MNPYELLGIAENATPAEIEAAYQQRSREYQLPAEAPADLQALAAEQQAQLDHARAHLLQAVPSGNGLSRREWLWMGAGVATALLIILLVVVFSNDAPPTPELVAVDRPAPDISLPTLDGAMINLADLQGKVVLVNFWATYCEPCKYETPDLVAAYAELKDQGLEIVGVNLADQDDLEEVRRFAQRYQVNYPIALDHEGVWQDAFGVFVIPHTYFIDSNGRIRYTRINVVTHEDIKRVLTELQTPSALEE